MDAILNLIAWLWGRLERESRDAARARRRFRATDEEIDQRLREMRREMRQQ